MSDEAAISETTEHADDCTCASCDPGRLGFKLPRSQSPDQHTYPSAYPKGKHWSLDAAWEMLDTIKPGVVPDDVRFLLAGMIAGRLMRERANGK